MADAIAQQGNVVMTTSAPIRRYLMTSSALWTPLLAASEAETFPARAPIHSIGRRISMGWLRWRSRLSRSSTRSMSG